MPNEAIICANIVWENTTAIELVPKRIYVGTLLRCSMLEHADTDVELFVEQKGCCAAYLTYEHNLNLSASCNRNE